MKPQQKRYTITMDESLDRDFESVAKTLGLSRAEAIRRAMILLKHAATADHVILKNDDGDEREVLIR